MKKLLLLLISCGPLLSQAQSNFTSLKEAKEATADGYKTASGWIIKEGDKIQTGRGTMPNKSFAYIYNAPGIALDVSRTPLGATWSSKQATVKKITFSGTKKSGLTPILVVGMGHLNNYWIEIDNAIAAGEIIPPAEFQKKDVPSTGTASVADELKKLKELLDAGAITQEEYDQQKKKLLNL